MLHAGNHQCVSVINNFIPREDVDIYTVAAKGQSEPKLPPAAAPALHKFVMQVVFVNHFLSLIIAQK